MSSFKRKQSSTSAGRPAAQTVFPGTRISPASTLSVITSTGISSLDDILGGGLPLSCSLLVAAPDIHSSYGELIQKYFVAQGLASGHRVLVVGQDPARWVEDLMWFPNGVVVKGGESDEEDAGKGEKVKIAWRYEKMKAFKTTVGYTGGDGEAYCAPLELSSRVPAEVIAEGVAGKRLTFVDVGLQSLSPGQVLEEVARALAAEGAVPLRICIPALGSPAWGDLTSQGVLRFLHGLRALLRGQTHGCASISLDGPLSAPAWGGPGWTEKLGWAVDGALTVAAFTANPALASAFPGHHGLLQTGRLPSPHTLGPPSDRFSALRGVGASVENNLAFKCTRKRLVFETLHLDVEGGTAERRTTPAAASATAGPKKEKKRVGFESDRPELYDF